MYIRVYDSCTFHVLLSNDKSDICDRNIWKFISKGLKNHSFVAGWNKTRKPTFKQKLNTRLMNSIIFACLVFININAIMIKIIRKLADIAHYLWQISTSHYTFSRKFQVSTRRINKTGPSFPSDMICWKWLDKINNAYCIVIMHHS